MSAKKKPVICFAASSGGHFEQLMMLRPLMEKYDSFILTEKTPYNVAPENIETYYVKQINRREKSSLLKLTVNFFISLKIFFKKKPTIIVTTGVLGMLPMCLLMKMFGKKLIYIESYAKVSSPTQTGKLLYKWADRFYVQWEGMLEFYPDATFIGGIY